MTFISVNLVKSYFLSYITNIQGVQMKFVEFLALIEALRIPKLNKCPRTDTNLHSILRNIRHITVFNIKTKNNLLIKRTTSSNMYWRCLISMADKQGDVKSPQQPRPSLSVPPLSRTNKIIIYNSAKLSTARSIIRRGRNSDKTFKDK